jgi:mono/diheme cytochrome c family protein
MLKRLLLAALAVSLTVSLGYADQSVKKIVIPVDKTNPTNGKQMFTSYCAPCHGVDGRGNGPAAPALRAKPVDLTGLAKANHGKFPDTHILAILQFGVEVPAHGSAEMPVWGPILGKMNHVNSQDKDLRMSNLSRYLENIQVK